MLVRYAIRTCAVMALRGATVVGQNVSDSRIGAIDIAADGSLRVDGDKPFIDVFTDDSDVSSDALRGPLDLHRAGTLALVLESGIASPMVETDPMTGESTVNYGVAVLPATDDRFEKLLDLVGCQIRFALTDPQNEWAELLRRFIQNVDQVQRRRVSREDDGIRRAALQTRIICRVRQDPVPGAPRDENDVWSQFRQKIENELPDELPIVDAMLGTPDAELTFDHLQQHSGRTEIAMRALGLGHADPENPDATWLGYEVERVEDEAAP